MRYDELDKNNYEAFAMAHYKNPSCSGLKQFMEDLELRPKWIKRLLMRYDRGGELRERLILNHIIILYNVFDIHPATQILLFKLEPELYPALKSFLVYLNYYGKRGVFPKLDQVQVDKFVSDRLQEIKAE